MNRHLPVVRSPLLLSRLSLTFAFIFGLAAVLLLGSGAVAHAGSSTECVNPGGTGGCFSSIQAAVNAAVRGDLITVAAGTYSEVVSVTIPLTITGSGTSSTTVNGDGSGNSIFTINSKNVQLSGFTITGGTGTSQSGVALTGATQSSIFHDVITGNSYGISILNSSNTSIKNNSITNNCDSPDGSNSSYLDGGAGINAQPQTASDVSNSLLINNNTIDGNCRMGIYLTAVLGTPSTGDKITKNTVFNNFTSQGGESGIDLLRVSSSDIKGNVVHDSGWDGIYCHDSCDKNLFYDNTSYANGQNANIIPDLGGGGEFGDGIQISGTASESAATNTLVYNNLHNNLRDGLLIRGNATGNKVHNNVMYGNARNGIKLGIEVQCNDPSTCGPNYNTYPSDPSTPVPTSNTEQKNTAISNVAVGIYTADPANPANYNTITGNGIGVQNTGATTVDATHNWWGCPTGPGTDSCDTISGLFTY
jgi:parallel beta-helix repeat protein